MKAAWLDGATDADVSTGKSPEFQWKCTPKAYIGRPPYGEVPMVSTYGTEGHRVVFAQVPLLRSQLEALKRRAGVSTTKDALQAAVDHYLRCPAAEEEEESAEQEQEKEWWWAPDRRAGT